MEEILAGNPEIYLRREHAIFLRGNRKYTTMTKRSVKYFKRKWLWRRFRVTSWHLDWMKMSQPEPGRQLAIMMPEKPATWPDGSLMIPKPEYYNPPPIMVTFHSAAERANEIFNRPEDNVEPIRPYITMTPRLHEEMKRRAEEMFKNMFPNQGESPERSVAENPS